MMTEDYAISACDMCGNKFPFNRGTILLTSEAAPIYVCPECVEKYDEEKEK